MYRFLALGDSYTIGESVAEVDRWPVQLAAALRQRGLDIVEPSIIAQTGWTTDELQSAIESAAPTGPFDLVSLQIGVNNQYRGYDLETYRHEFSVLLETAIGFTAGQAARVMVLSIPDWGVTPFADGQDRAKIALDIDRYNAVKREEITRAGAYYVDITPQSRLAANEPAQLASDRLHPSGVMYAAWVDLVLPVALAILT